MYEFVDSGSTIDLDTFMYHDEHSFAEGQRGILTLECRWSVGQDVIDALNRELAARGVEGGYARADGETLNIYFRKGFPWLTVIAGIILALVVLAVLVVAWRVYREVLEIIPEPLKPVFGIGIAILTGYVALKVLQKSSSQPKGRYG